MVFGLIILTACRQPFFKFIYLFFINLFFSASYKTVYKGWK